MNTQHTPGRWFVSIQKMNVGNLVTVDPNICVMKQTDEQAEANARLIAAAPELLQMVHDLKKCIERLTADDVSQFHRDTEAYWIGEAHELLHKASPDYYKNANQ